MGKTITISLEEYDRLVEDSRVLTALENNGVDNWEYYDEAMRDVYDEEDDNDD